MGILNNLTDQQSWQDFFEYKQQKSHLTKQEEIELKEFIDNKSFETIAINLQNEKYDFSIPTKKLISKSGTDKKRTVYTFSKEENMILKFIAYSCFVFDENFCPNLFSFRKDFGVTKAIKNLLKIPNLNEMYCYKTDISNYFNSINVQKLLPLLAEVLKTDTKLFDFFKTILTQKYVCFNGKIIEENKGVMAGTPISPFFANVFLMNVDKYFFEQNIIYTRYSDDIILFAPSQELLEKNVQILKDFISQYDLEINPQKELYFLPNEEWEFLGISYQNKKINLSKNSLKKIKGKIRRKSRALFRWKTKKNQTTEKAISVLIKKFNYKFFENEFSTDLTWSRWFFPLLTQSDRLKQIDQYLQQNARYLSTGKYNKQNFKITYQNLKNLGYKSLVNEYYKYKTKIQN